MATSSTSAKAQEATRASTKSPEAFESLRERAMAAETLQSYEKLSWIAFQRCETITQTRLRCKRQIAGFSPSDEDELITWEEDFTPHYSQAKPSSKKGKERASTGGGGSSKGKERQSLGAGQSEKSTEQQ